MTLEEILNSNNLDIEMLQKGLKHLGLDLSKFKDINVNQISTLLELFKVVINIDPHKSNKFTKIDLRLRLEKIQKAQFKNDKDTPTYELVKPNCTTPNQQHGNLKSFADLKVPQSQNHRNIKLGKVKFFDSTKGFGYVYSLDDKRDCFIHISKILTPPINENDIVVFQTIESRKKPGELDAIEISTRIPVFIINKESCTKSSAIVLLDNHLANEIQFTEKLEPGFCHIRLISISTS